MPSTTASSSTDGRSVKGSNETTDVRPAAWLTRSARLSDGRAEVQQVVLPKRP